jgi:hypothetical protein
MSLERILNRYSGLIEKWNIEKRSIRFLSFVAFFSAFHCRDIQTIAMFQLFLPVLFFPLQGA